MPESTWNFNTIYIVESLPEFHTGRRLAEELGPICEPLQLRCGLITVQDAADFERAMKRVRDEADRALLPILHFEIHGDAGGFMLASEDRVSWKDCTSFWREINRRCRNNLAVILATCHGFQSISEVRAVHLPCPFFTLVGPNEQVNAGQIETDFPRFYRTLLQNGDFDAACAQLNGPYHVFRAEQVFFRSYASYLEKYVSARQRQFRSERVVTEIMRRTPERFGSASVARRHVKAALKPSEEKFQKAKDVFLMASDPANLGRFSVKLSDVVGAIERKRHRFGPS